MANYSDLLNVDEFGEKRTSFNEERGDISFYCKDCEEIVEAERADANKYLYICKKCQGKHIAIGTLSGLKENYHLK